MHLDFLSSMTSVKVLNEMMCKSASCKNKEMLGGDKKKSTYTIISCLCGSEVGLVSKDSCNIIMGESTNDESAKEEAASKELID